MDPVSFGSLEELPQCGRRSERPLLPDLSLLEPALFFARSLADLRLLSIAKTLKLARHATITETDCSMEVHAPIQLGPTVPRAGEVRAKRMIEKMVTIRLKLKTPAKASFCLAGI